MSSYRAHSYSDNLNPRRPSTGSQQGPSIGSEIDGAGLPLHPDKLRKAGLFATSVAIRQGWTPEEAPGELADVLRAIGF
jgi:hypothetical protein